MSTCGNKTLHIKSCEMGFFFKHMDSTFSLAIRYFHKQTECLTRVKKITSHELEIFAINLLFFTTQIFSTCDMLLAFFPPMWIKISTLENKNTAHKIR